MGTCFVVMGFGKKTDFETGRTLDLDKTYRNIIKPAVTAAGLECTRADEVSHSGIIDVPMYERLLSADVVVADLSTSNKNAFYELGVRHALRPRTTIVICEDGAKSFPFDVNHVAIRQYHHMGEGIDYDEVERFRTALTKAIKEIQNQNPPAPDSPVYTFLRDLTPPALAQALKDVASEVAKAAPAIDSAAQATSMILGEIMMEVDEAQGQGDFVAAKALLSRLRRKMKDAAKQAAQYARDRGQTDVQERPEDPYVLQRLALVTYKSEIPSAKAALEEAREVLAVLDPSTSNDTETLGLWGAVHKRLWEATSEMPHLEEAIRAYQRGFYLRNDYYNGINFAYLLNLRAADCASRAATAHSTDEVRELRAEAVTCFVDASKVRREVLAICEAVLAREKLSNDARYWVLATIAEACLGLGDHQGKDKALSEAFALTPKEWMKKSTNEQLDKLSKLVSNSPLAFVDGRATT